MMGEVLEGEEEKWHRGYNIMFGLYFLHHLPVGSNLSPSDSNRRVSAWLPLKI